MAIEIVSFPMKKCDFPMFFVNVYQAGYLLASEIRIFGRKEIRMDAVLAGVVDVSTYPLVICYSWPWKDPPCYENRDIPENHLYPSISFYIHI